MAERVRSFVALEIDSAAKERIGDFLSEMRRRPGGEDLKWVRPEILHMTVRFFGDLDRKQLGKARQAIARIDHGWDPPSLSMGSLGGFPSLDRPKVVWLGLMDRAGELARLASEVDLAIRRVGFGQADKPFVAHLTLARARRGRRIPDVAGLTGGLTPPTGPLTIRAITLFQSDLLPEGPRYTPLEIAQPRSDRSGTDRPDGEEAERRTEETSLPPRARRTGQDPQDTKEGDRSNG